MKKKTTKQIGSAKYFPKIFLLIIKTEEKIRIFPTNQVAPYHFVELDRSNRGKKFLFFLVVVHFIIEPQLIFCCSLSICKNELRQEFSVTRFGEIWRNFATLAKIFKVFDFYLRVYFVLGKILNLSGPFLGYWANFHCFHWPNIEEIILPSGHTGQDIHFLLFNSVPTSRGKEGRASEELICETFEYFFQTMRPFPASFCLLSVESK